MKKRMRRMFRLAVVLLFVLPLGAGWLLAQEESEPDGAFEQEVPTVSGEQLLPLGERTRLFRIISGDGAGEEAKQTLRRAGKDEPGEWVLELNGLNVLYLRHDDEGAVEMVRMDLPREDRAVTYLPAVRMIPARLHPRLSEIGTGTARIYNLESGERTRLGAYRHEIEQVARARFDLPSGMVDGFLVVLDHSIDVDFGEVRLELEAGYVPGEGLVYRHLRYTRQKLGLFGETIRRTSVLTEPAVSADERSRSGQATRSE